MVHPSDGASIPRPVRAVQRPDRFCAVIRVQAKEQQRPFLSAYPPVCVLGLDTEHRKNMLWVDDGLKMGLFVPYFVQQEPGALRLVESLPVFEKFFGVFMETGFGLFAWGTVGAFQRQGREVGEHTDGVGIVELDGALLHLKHENDRRGGYVSFAFFPHPFLPIQGEIQRAQDVLGHVQRPGGGLVVLHPRQPVEDRPVVNKLMVVETLHLTQDDVFVLQPFLVPIDAGNTGRVAVVPGFSTEVKHVPLGGGQPQNIIDDSRNAPDRDGGYHIHSPALTARGTGNRRGI